MEKKDKYPNAQKWANGEKLIHREIREMLRELGFGDGADGGFVHYLHELQGRTVVFIVMEGDALISVDVVQAFNHEEAWDKYRKTDTYNKFPDLQHAITGCKSEAEAIEIFG